MQNRSGGHGTLAHYKCVTNDIEFSNVLKIKGQYKIIYCPLDISIKKVNIEFLFNAKDFKTLIVMKNWNVSFVNYLH